MRVALDTNVLAYAEGVNGSAMKVAALTLVRKLPKEAIAVPVQALGELFHVLVRKGKYPAAVARTAILDWRDTYPVIDTSDPVLVSAVDLATSHQLAIWDSIILSAAAEGSCRLLLSEDMHEGFTWKGATVTNPFAPTRHPLLDALLSGS